MTGARRSTLDGTRSTGDGPLTCIWTFEDADGATVWETIAGCKLSKTFQAVDTKYVKLTVTDADGDTDSSKQSFAVGERAGPDADAAPTPSPTPTPTPAPTPPPAPRRPPPAPRRPYGFDERTGSAGQRRVQQWQLRHDPRRQASHGQARQGASASTATTS